MKSITMNINDLPFKEFKTDVLISTIDATGDEPIQTIMQIKENVTHRRYKRTEGKWKGWLSKFYEVEL